MFKKDGSDASSAQPRQTQTAGGRTPPPRKGGGPATIGPSITIKGDVSGDEDLMIQGRVEGKVNLAKHNITIGSDGRVKADVHGRMVVVEGEVEGDLRGQEQIILRHSAKVEGSIAAPRVTLEDGAVFRGGIEMDATAGDAKPMIGKKADAGQPSGAVKDEGSTKAKDSNPEKGPGKSLQA